MTSKLTHEQEEYFRTRFEALLTTSMNKRYVHTAFHSGYTWFNTDPTAPMEDPVMHTETVYNVEIPEHQLIQLIECMQAYEDQMLMADRYPAVREAWMNLRTIMMLTKS